MAAVVETHVDVAAYEAVLASGRILVCQLQASSETRRARIAARERGSGLTWHLNRTDELQAQLDAMRLADFEVSNDGRAIQEVAAEVLLRVNWLTPSHPL